MSYLVANVPMNKPSVWSTSETYRIQWVNTKSVIGLQPRAFRTELYFESYVNKYGALYDKSSLCGK